jgi:hypothetical protein
MTELTAPFIEECPRCGVLINGEKVHFAYPPGKPGSKERLYERVCKFTKDTNCINNYHAQPEHISKEGYVMPFTFEELNTIIKHEQLMNSLLK